MRERKTFSSHESNIMKFGLQYVGILKIACGFEQIYVSYWVKSCSSTQILLKGMHRAITEVIDIVPPHPD